MTELEILEKVRAIMNEAGSEESLTLLDEDNIKLDTYIKSAIPDAVNLVAQNSPVRCVNMKSDTAIIKTMATDSNSGYITLPSDFVSLIAFKISSWKRIVAQLFSINSEEYKAQAGGYQTAGLNKPMCFLSYSGATKILEFYAKGMVDGDAISTFAYEARYNSTSGLDLDKNDPLAQAICYMCASLVYSVFENTQTSKEMQTIALNLIPK